MRSSRCASARLIVSPRPLAHRYVSFKDNPGQQADYLICLSWLTVDSGERGDVE